MHKKRNLLFIGYREAGERSAVIYTLLGSCRRHGVNPFDYLKDLFTLFVTLAEYGSFATRTHEVLRELAVMSTAFSLALLCSCATRSTDRLPLPPVASMSSDAGCGGLLLLKVRLGTGDELPFVVDTGSPFTLVDKSLEAKLGKCFGTRTIRNFSATQKSRIYAAPEIHIGTTRLITGARVYAYDLTSLATVTRRPIMGILGMDVLRHYCLQLDFESGKVRFLESSGTNTAKSGKWFRLAVSRHGCPILRGGSLVGAKDALIDTGFDQDGALDGDLVGAAESTQLSMCTWAGQTYTNLIVGKAGNLVGLRFLARHLVVFDFPKHRMYLQRTRIGPLLDTANETLLNSISQCRLPGFAEGDKAQFTYVMTRWAATFDGQKTGDSSVYHFKYERTSPAAEWRLQKAWRTDGHGHTLEEYAVP